MTNKERVRACGQCQPIDRVPFSFYFGPWSETIDQWRKEGIDNPNAWQDGFGFDPQVITLSNYVNHLHCPGFTHEVIERRGDIIIQRDRLGQIIESIAGVAGIPKILHSPVSSQEDWNRLKREQLDPDHPDRFPADWQEIIDLINTTDAPVQVGTYPCGLYGTMRDLMGVENSLMAFYDQPKLVEDIMGYLTEFWIAIYEKICQHVQVDILHIWEDMSGKQGSLISPKLIKQYMLPNYKKLKAFALKHDIAIFQVDTDGNCEELIPLFEQSGVNMMLPFEVAAGCDVINLREKYPRMSMMGGIDKREIAKSKADIDRELERIRPLLSTTGYFPMLDHLIHPEISFENYHYFVNQLKKMIFHP